MEKQILKIIYNSGLQGSSLTEVHEIASKEIASHFMEFMEWVREEVLLELCYSEWRWIYPAIDSGEVDNHFTSSESLYSYWLTNIKNK